MKKVISMLMIAAMLLTSAGSAYTANPAVVSISIAISHTLDLNVTGSIDFPVTDPIVPGTAKIAATALTVENIGTGVDLTVTLSEVAVDGWSTYYQFAAERPTDLNDTNWKAAASVPGEVISHGTANAKQRWFKLVPPDTTPETSIGLSLTLTAAIG